MLLVSLAGLASSAQEPLPFNVQLDYTGPGTPLRLYWEKLSETSATFRICTPYPGWIGVSVNPSQARMAGSDIFFATKSGGAWIVEARFATGYSTPALRPGTMR